MREQSLSSRLTGGAFPRPTPLHPVPPMPNDPLGLVDRTEHPSMMIDGRKIERIADRRCPCGCRADIFQHREVATKANDKSLDSAPGGWRVLWESPSLCPTCSADRLARSSSPQFETRRLDRGVHRSVILEAAGWRRGQGTMMGQLEAEVFEEIAAHSGDWIATAALTDHPHGRQIAPIVANMLGEATPPGAKFKLGPVEIERNLDLFIGDSEAGACLDRHAQGDHGVFGPEAEELSEASAWCPALSTIPEMNLLARINGDGPIRSAFIRDQLTNGHRVAVEVTTFRRHHEASTLVTVSMRF